MALAGSQSKSPFLAHLPQRLPKTQAEWQSHLNALQAWARSLTTQAWTAATLQNSWVNYGSPYANAAYSQGADGTVRCRGLIKGGTATNGTVLLTLPYLPQYQKVLTALANNGTAYVEARLDVKTDGTVTVTNLGTVSGTYFVSLDQLSYSVSA